MLTDRLIKLALFFPESFNRNFKKLPPALRMPTWLLMILLSIITLSVMLLWWAFILCFFAVIFLTYAVFLYEYTLATLFITAVWWTKPRVLSLTAVIAYTVSR